MALRFVCLDRSLEDGPSYLVAGGRYCIGRSTKCDFVLLDLSVSRRHAEFDAGDGSLRIRDLQSRNGTFIGTERITGELELLPGQIVRFGHAQFQLIVLENIAMPDAEMSELSTYIIHNKPSLLPNPLDQLTPAERRVFELLMTGRGEKEIAAGLNNSLHTVHNHVRKIYKKLNVNSRFELLTTFASENKKTAG